MIGCLLAIVVFPVVGEALSRLVGPMQRYLAGAGIVGTSLFLAGLVGVRISVAALLIGVAAVVILLVRPSKHHSAVGHAVVPDALFALFSVWLLFVTRALPLDDYDGRAFWLLKAKAIAHEQQVDGPFFQQLTSPSPRNQYPLLLPIDAALMMLAGGELDEWQARWFYACFGIAFGLLLRRRIGSGYSPSLGSWAGAALLSLPMMLSRASGAASAGSDVALGAFAAAGFFEIVAAESPLRVGLWLSFAVLTKSEGLPLAMCLLLLGAFVFRGRVLVACLPLLLTVSAFLFWRTRIHRSDENPFASMILDLPQHARRFSDFLQAFAGQPLEFRLWGIFWIVFLCAVAVLLFERQTHVLAKVGVILLPVVTLYAGVVAVTDWEYAVINPLAPRLLLHLLGPAFYAIAEAQQCVYRRYRYVSAPIAAARAPSPRREIPSVEEMKVVVRKALGRRAKAKPFAEKRCLNKQAADSASGRALDDLRQSVEQRQATAAIVRYVRAYVAAGDPARLFDPASIN